MRENPSLKQQAIGACEETRSQWRDRTHPVRGQFPIESEQPLAESEESLILCVDRLLSHAQPMFDRRPPFLTSSHAYSLVSSHSPHIQLLCQVPSAINSEIFIVRLSLAILFFFQRVPALRR